MKGFIQLHASGGKSNRLITIRYNGGVMATYVDIDPRMARKAASWRQCSSASTAARANNTSSSNIALGLILWSAETTSPFRANKSTTGEHPLTVVPDDEAGLVDRTSATAAGSPSNVAMKSFLDGIESSECKTLAGAFIDAGTCFKSPSSADMIGDLLLGFREEPGRSFLSLICLDIWQPILTSLSKFERKPKIRRDRRKKCLKNRK